MSKKSIIFFEPTSGRILSNDSEVGRLNYSERLIFMRLISNRNKIISKDELLAAGWPERIVVSNSLTIAVRNIRSSLERAGIYNEPETVPKMGYKLSIEVISIDDSMQQQIENVSMSNSALNQTSTTEDHFAPNPTEHDYPQSFYAGQLNHVGKKLYQHMYSIYVIAVLFFGVLLYGALIFSEPIFQCVEYENVTFCGAHKIEREDIPKSYFNEGAAGEYWFVERDDALSFFKTN